MREIVEYILGIVVWVIVSIIIGLPFLCVMGCSHKRVEIILPEVTTLEGIVIPQHIATYDEWNFFSESSKEGVWIQYDGDGLIAELNKTETTMDAAIKLAEFVIPLVQPGK